MTMRTDESDHKVLSMTKQEAMDTLVLEENLIQALRGKHLRRARKVLNELLVDFFRLSGNDVDLLKHRSGELITLMSRSIEAGDVEEVFVFGYEALQNLQSIINMDELLHWMNYVLKCFFSFLGDSQHEDFFVKTAKKYVERNAHRKILLQDVASHVYMSPDYFGKRFRAETGMTFSRYLQEVRIQRTLEYLCAHRYSLREIAQMFHFSDQSHYTRVFKNIVGVTPNQYRENKRNKNTRQTSKRSVTHG